MFKSFKELKEEKAKKQEGKVVELPDEKEVLEVSTEPVDTKIEKEDKTSFEEFKVLYKGQIDDKCLEDYGTIEDEKLWEDTAKELFMASEDYIPDEDDKAEKIEESKPYIRRKDGSEELTKSELNNKYKEWREDNNWSKEEYSFNDYLRDIDESGEWELVESKSDRYQVREYEGSGAKFGVYDTKEKKFVQKGSKYIMDAACKDLNEKGKVTESSIIKYTLKEMMNKKQESIEDGASIFELKFDCSNEDTFGVGQEMINPIADTLREVIEKIEIGRFDGPIMDVNGNKIGSFGIGYEGVQSGLSESKKVEESVREDLIQLRKDNKGLYDYVANNYYNMSAEELKEIALNAIYVADNDFKIIDEYLDRMDESVDTDIEKAKEDSIEKGLYCEKEELSESRPDKEAARAKMFSDSRRKLKLPEESFTTKEQVLEYLEKCENETDVMNVNNHISDDTLRNFMLDLGFSFNEKMGKYPSNAPEEFVQFMKDGLQKYEGKKEEAVEEEINVTDANEDINSIMVTYISNQTFMKYYNLEKPITEDEIKNIKLKIKNHEMYVTDIKDKLGATEVNSKKELIPNTYIMKIKENDIEDLEEEKHDSCIMCGSDNLDGCFVLKSKNICKECGKKYSLEEIENKLESKNIKTESQVSDYTFKELNKVVNDKGNDFKIQIAGSEDKTNWLNIDKEDLQAIYQALQNKNAK